MVDTIQDIDRIAADIEGLSTSKEMHYLYELARKAKGNGCIVEIGSWKGKSTVWLAKGSQAGENSKIYAVDPHKDTLVHNERKSEGTEAEFRRNIEKAGIADMVTPLVMESEKAAQGWTEPIKLLWIDGSHEYEDVKKDFLLWEPHLIDGCTVAFHDWEWRGARPLIRDYVLKKARFSRVKAINWTISAQKRRCWFSPSRFYYLIVAMLLDFGSWATEPRIFRKIRALYVIQRTSFFTNVNAWTAIKRKVRSLFSGQSAG